MTSLSPLLLLLLLLHSPVLHSEALNSMSRGLNLNNPSNLMCYPQFAPWKGEIRPTTDPDGRLCQFDTVQHGIRAAIKQFRIYQDKHGCRTLAEIVTRLAPADENDTQAYIAYMAEEMNIDPNAPVDLHDNKTMVEFLNAQTRYEQGTACLRASDIASAINSA